MILKISFLALLLPLAECFVEPIASLSPRATIIEDHSTEGYPSDLYGFSETYKNYLLNVLDNTRTNVTCLHFAQTPAVTASQTYANDTFSVISTNLVTGSLTITKAEFLFTSDTTVLNPALAASITSFNPALQTNQTENAVLSKLFNSSVSGTKLSTAKLSLSGTLTGNSFYKSTKSIEVWDTTLSSLSLEFLGSMSSIYLDYTMSNLTISSISQLVDPFAYPQVYVAISYAKITNLAAWNTTLSGSLKLNGVVTKRSTFINVSYCQATVKPEPTTSTTSFDPYIIGAILVSVPVLIAVYIWRKKLPVFFLSIKYRFMGARGIDKKQFQLGHIANNASNPAQSNAPVPPVNSLSPSAFKHDLYRIPEQDSQIGTFGAKSYSNHPTASKKIGKS
jgi:hypothetical protein